ncbi:MAG TPA: EAL domain-containing protein [Steroidobacteraceae bacterium]|nr:EAL domain-containing protein [Steroidobacteraceae bacterium]
MSGPDEKRRLPKWQILSRNAITIAVVLGLCAWVADLAFPPLLPDSITTAAELLAIVGMALLAYWSWREQRRMQATIEELIDAAERLSRSEFSQPVASGSTGYLGLLQRAFERMRVALHDTTYSRDYLHSVLNSMSDSVFVAAPDGAIRIVNDAAQRLTGYSADELSGMQIASLLAANVEEGVDPLVAARELGETVLRTRAGQTIPVSFVVSTVTALAEEFAGDIYVARDITERKRAERRIRYLARYDALTKIPNRMQFQHLLQQAIARARRLGQGVALLYIDMDRFKEVNDTFGHASGDRVLELLTERLTRALSSDTVIGRLAGDEFALFVDGLPTKGEEAGEQVAQLARTVLDTVGAAFHVSQQEVVLTVSIGVAFCPRDADNVIDLIRNADAAMYYSKQNGGNTFAFYSQEMNAAAVERLMLKSKLRRAVERDEFVVQYQPKVDLRDGRIVGAEALLRWRLPGHGDIPPSQFIPIAEENDLISAIGAWVLERVCIDYKLLRRAVTNPGRISLNLSLKQLRHAGFILNCRSLFERHNVPPQSLELEITETTLMADPRRTVQMLDQLAAIGLHLSIDDFGTGYSSLSALQQFPIGTLKIDQSFVRDVADDPADATLVRTIIDMGHGLGLKVVAEGVELARQVPFLRKWDCDLAQGRLFGEAVGIQELLAQLLTQQAGPPAFAAIIAAASDAALRA